MSNKVLDLSLYLVLDPVLTEKLGMVRTAELAVQGGATIVQLRAPQWKKRQRYECALELKTVLDSYHVPLIIDDDIDIALAVDADGVHVGQKDLPADVTRRLMGKDKIVGLSINNEEQMNLVDPMTVNYVGIGPVFSTKTKTDAEPAFDLKGLSSLAQLCPVPAVAIGGIKAEHIEAISQTKVQGVAVVSAICGQDNPQKSAQLLACLWQRYHRNI